MASIVAFALILTLFFLQAQNHILKNPLRGDEVDFYGCMENVVSLRLPLYYAGEVDLSHQSLIYLSTRYLGNQEFVFYRFRPETKIFKETFFALSDGTSRYTYCLWHPPLYVYLGSLYFRVVSLTPATSMKLRYFNLIFSFGIFTGMFVLSRAIYRTHPARVAALATLLYVGNSLATRGAILIDYNGTLGPCVATWFAVAYTCSLGERPSRKDYIAVGVLMTLAFLTGLSIGLTIFVSVYVHALIALRARQRWQLLLAPGIGAAAFIPVFFGLSRLLNLPFSQPFLHNFQRINAKADSNWLIMQGRNALEYSIFYSREIGWIVVLLAAVLTILLHRWRSSARSSARAFAPILLTIGFLLHGSLRAEAYGFPKYILFLLPPLFVYMAGEMLNLFSILRTSRSSQILAGIVLMLIIVTEARGAVVSMQRPGSTLYFAGEQGIEAISDEVRLLTRLDETILSAKDIAFFAHRKFVQWSGALTSDSAILQHRVEKHQIRLLASNAGLLGVVSPAVADYLTRMFPLSRQRGDFRVLYTSISP